MFGKKLKKLRKEKNMSQTELGEKIGAGAHAISRYENNKVTPSTETMIKFSEIFNVSIDYLIFDRETKESLENENPELIQKLKNIEMLDKEDQTFLFKIIDTLLAKKKMNEIFKKSA